jgi:hypothetical protein
MAEPLLRRVQGLVTQVKSSQTGTPGGVAHGLPAVLDELRHLGASTVAVYGDAALREQVDAGVGTHSIWTSHRATDCARGAIKPHDERVLGADVIVVGGKDLKTAYVHLLRLLVGRQAPPHVLWVGEGFEFCLGSLAVPAAATKADIYLHNHFDAYFSMRDPLLVEIRAGDGKTLHQSQYIIGPCETIHLSLDELLPDRSGEAFFELRTTHPVLTRGRHHRWRITADVHWGQSFTTLHGAHDEGPDRRTQSRVSSTLIGDGQLVLTIPNYDLAMRSSGTAVTCYDAAGNKTELARSTSKPVEEVQFRGTNTRGHFAYEYLGYGTSFVYGMRRVQGHDVVFANHELTIDRTATKAPALTAERRAALEAIEQGGVVLLPHALPILEGDIQLGFSFAAATPTTDQFVVRAYDAAGTFQAQSRVRDPLDGPLFPAQLLERCDPPFAKRPAMVIIAPDWRAMDADPAAFNMAGELVVRHEQSGDFDITEFQNCWRNAGSLIDEFPHWIHPTNALISRTRLIGRVVHGAGVRTGLVLVHGSGDTSAAGSADVEVQVLDPRGRTYSHELELPAFTHRLVWFDEAFADLKRMLPQGFGTTMILSPNRDLNVQLVTVDEASRAVSIQHLWGY